MHGQGMETVGKFCFQQIMDKAMTSNGFEGPEAVADDEEFEMRFPICGRVVLAGFINKFKMERIQFLNDEVLDALVTIHRVSILGCSIPVRQQCQITRVVARHWK